MSLNTMLDVAMEGEGRQFGTGGDVKPDTVPEQCARRLASFYCFPSICRAILDAQRRDRECRTRWSRRSRPKEDAFADDVGFIAFLR